ncbi:MAG: autotransporter assembly complex protein TamA [Gammaproteobacteria bacterium]|nr:autotransporter assembly complex protein TamA [Gammaproteobacteria bacterium]
MFSSLFKPLAIALLLLLASFQPAWLWAAEKAEQMQVEITGIEDPLKKNAELNLDWKKVDISGLSQAYLEQRLVKSEALIHQALEPFGYYNATVQSQLQQHKDQWSAHYAVTPGPVTTVGTLDIQFTGEGQQDPALLAAAAEFPLQQEMPLIHSQYESGKSAINKQLTASGYLDASLSKSKVTVDKASNSANIALQWQTGKAYRFGSLTTHTDHIDPRLLKRWANFKQGDRFSYETLLEFQRRLDSSGFFQSSEIAIDTQPETGLADVTVETSPAARRLYRGSVGYGTDTGARTQLGFEQRWLNKYGHSLRSGARIAEREQSYSVTYHVPALRGRADSYNYSWTRRDQQLPEYDTRSDRLSAVQISNTSSWQIQWGINLERDSFIIGDTQQSDTLWYLENQWSKYKSSQPVYPNKADSLSINGRVGAGFDGEQKYFSRLHVQQLWIRPAPWAGRILLRGAAGALWSDSFDRLPPQHRFYSGGDRNVRGYDYQSLSPVDANNNRVGGRYLAELSAELDYRFAESWAVAGFVDAGQAFNNEDTDLAVGTGLGIRFITSLLVVRMDVANAISEDDKPWRLHLTLGTDF